MGYLDQLKSIQNTTTRKMASKANISNGTSSSNIKQSQNSSAKYVDPLDMESEILPKRYTRDVDPAVRRLKELRRQKQLEEDAKRGGTSKARRAAGGGSSRKSEDKDSNITSTRFRKKIETKLQNAARPSALKNAPVVKEKKLSFEALMAQAEQSNSTATKKTSKSAPVRKKPVELSSWKSKKKSTLPPQPRSVPDYQARPRSATPTDTEKLLKISSTVKSGPSKKMKKILDQRKKHGGRQSGRPYGSDEDDEEEYDSELDDFIEEDDPGYDRSEIWRLMSNGRSEKRRYVNDDDDDSDDMEANGIDILEEEEASRKYARLEDKREEAWLKNHDKQKRKRLGKD